MENVVEDSFDLELCIGFCLDQLKDNDETERYLKKAENHSLDAGALCVLAEYWIKLKKYQKGQDFFDQS